MSKIATAALTNTRHCEAAPQKATSTTREFASSFAMGTRIAGLRGERRIEDLRIGDLIITRDHGVQVLRDIRVQPAPADMPFALVLIRQGILGRGLPERDLLVSADVPVISGVSGDLEFPDVCQPARDLVGRDGIDLVEGEGIVFYHLCFDQNVVLLADGIWSECQRDVQQAVAAPAMAGQAPRVVLRPMQKGGVAQHWSRRYAMQATQTNQHLN